MYEGCILDNCKKFVIRKDLKAFRGVQIEKYFEFLFAKYSPETLAAGNIE